MNRRCHRTAHPDFAAHFTSPIYDPDDVTNDETAPFGRDEGADLYAEWADRTTELQRLSLHEMLAIDNGPSGSRTGPASLDDFTIAACFIHLRATGWLDRKGVSWLRAALQRKNRAHPKAEFATMLQDLATYSNRPPRSSKPPPERGWLRIDMSGGDRPLTRWCQTTEKAFATDPAWSAWWASASIDALDFCPHIFLKKADVSVRQEGQLLIVTASAPNLGRVTRKHLGGVVTSDSPPLPSLMTLPNYRTMLEDLLMTAMRVAAAQTHLRSPPPHLPPQP